MAAAASDKAKKSSATGTSGAFPMSVSVSLQHVSHLLLFIYYRSYYYVDRRCG